MPLPPVSGCDSTKYIGPVYDPAQADALQAEKGWVFKADGKAFRRVGPSPQPKRIVESDAIQALIARDHLVICNGGGITLPRVLSSPR